QRLILEPHIRVAGFQRLARFALQFFRDVGVGQDATTVGTREAAEQQAPAVLEMELRWADGAGTGVGLALIEKLRQVLRLDSEPCSGLATGEDLTVCRPACPY